MCYSHHVRGLAKLGRLDFKHTSLIARSNLLLLLVNRGCRMSKNGRKNLLSVVANNITTYASLYLLTSKVTGEVDLKFDVVEIISRSLRH